MPVRFDKVSECIYRGGAPSYSDLDIFVDIFGIKTILSLDGVIGKSISPKVKSLGMEHIIIPINGEYNLDKMDYIIDYLKNKQPIYVHCRHGSDRTGVAIALYRIKEQGWDPDKALKEALLYDFGEKLSPKIEKVYCEFIKQADAVSQMRDQFDMGRVPPAFLPMQSFAPREDVKFWPPDSILNDSSAILNNPAMFNMELQYPASDSDKRVLILQEILNDIIPNIGQYDNFDGIRGAGPLAGDDTNTGGFSYPGGGVPGGAGVANTGGFLNL